VFNLKTLETLTKLLDVADDKPERQRQQPLDPWAQPATAQPQDTGMEVAL
jgi:hypothetical protein